MADSKKDRNRRQTGDDLAPDAWERFERAVDVVAKSGPKPKSKPKPKPKKGQKTAPKKGTWP